MRLVIVDHNPTSPSAFYRSTGVLGPLARQRAIDVIVTSDPEWLDWAKLLTCDAVFMRAPVAPECFMLAQLCQDCSVPLWVDYDDHMFALGRDNAGYDAIMRSRDVIKRIVRCARLVTVSTPALQEVFPGSVVVPNACPDFWRFFAPQSRNIMTWRGGPAHLADQAEFMPAITRIAGEIKDWEFHFFGRTHWDLPGKVKHHAWSGIMEYMREFTLLSPSVHIVPMRKTPFNVCKSNCCWLEASAAGAEVVAPDWPEWRRPGIRTYSDESTFIKAVVDAVAAKSTRALEDSRRYIRENLMLSKVNEQRFNLLREIAA